MDEFFTDYRMEALERPLDPPADRIAPPEDNPFPKWLRFGVNLAGTWTRAREPELWPRDFNYNPMLIYLTGRRRDQAPEDWIALTPWILLSLLEALVALGILGGPVLNRVLNLFVSGSFSLSPFSGDFGRVLRLLLAAPLMLAPVVGLLSMLLVRRHLVRLFQTVSVHQVAVTRLTPAQILHGIVIRPLAVLSVGCLFNTLLWIPHLLALGIETKSIGSFLYYVIAGSFLLMLRWTLFTSCLIAGAALAIRAHFFFSSPGEAASRMMMDWARRMALPLVLLWGLFLFPLSGALLIIPQVLFSLLVLGYYVTLGFSAEGVIRWTADHSREWWVLSGDEPAEGIPRWIWARWRSLDPKAPEVPLP
jgi:hypothetical protein